MKQLKYEILVDDGNGWKRIGTAHTMDQVYGCMAYCMQQGHDIITYREVTNETDKRV